MADEVTIEEDGPLLLIGVNRPDAHNLWNLEVIQAVSRACKRLADAEHLRVGVIFGHGRCSPRDSTSRRWVRWSQPVTPQRRRCLTGIRECWEAATRQRVSMP